ncbi:SLAF5 protein, partial [Crocuta crocuta]
PAAETTEAVVFCLSAAPGFLGGDTAGEMVISILGESPLGPLRSQRGRKWKMVTWSSGPLAAVLQPGPGGKPTLAGGTQGPYGRRLHALQHGYSLRIRPLRLQDS